MTRRTALACAASGLLVRAADPWKTKKTGDWTPEEVRKLSTHSPWAKEVTVDMPGPPMGGGGMGGRGGRGMGGGMGGGMGDAESGGGGDMGGGRMGGMGGGGPMGEGGMRPQMRLLVRWESAQPMYDSTKRQRPAQANDYYLISLSGLRMPMGPPGGREREAKAKEPGQEGPDAAARRQAMIERLKEATVLERKSKDPIHPEAVNAIDTPRGPLFIFAFPRASQPIVAEDKEVTFHSKAGSLDIKAKFNLKDMVYDGKLEL